MTYTERLTLELLPGLCYVRDPSLKTLYGYIDIILLLNMVVHDLKSHCQPQCIVRPNLLGGHFNGGIIDVSVFNP